MDVRLLILTHRLADPSYRVRWGRLRERLRAEGVDSEAAEIPERWRGRGKLYRRAADFDVVVLHRRLLTALDLWRLRRRARRLVYDFDDALFYRPVPPHRSDMREARFFLAVSSSDLVLAGNRVLAGFARLRNARVVVAPSTVGIGPPPVVERLAEFTAVWIGQRATLPHLETVGPALRAAGFRLRVVADAAPDGCELVPWSAESERAALAECHVGLMPLPRDPFARGKCGYKLLQYYEAGLPAVATPLGVNRVLAAGGALLADGPEEWVAALGALRDDPARRERLGARGRAFVTRRYAADPLAVRLAHLLKGIAFPD